MALLVLILQSQALLLGDGLLGSSVDLDWLLCQIEHLLADNSSGWSLFGDVASADQVPAYSQGGSGKP